jgi:glycosyltransferase involved in cell wall biosynthesis
LNIHRQNPLVSIGMPVYNGENYITEALDSLLAQTYSNVELIISDNASTDSTETICSKYVAADRRIRYYRNEQNLGAAANYNRVVELAQGKYFKWAAHDDIHGPTLVQRCVEVLEQDESIVLCHTKTTIIDEHGRPYLNYLVTLDTMSDQPHLRLRELICREHWCYPIFGVFRLNVLKKTALIASYSDSDRVLLAELGIRGRIYEIPEVMFFRREHPETSTRKYATNEERMVWFDPKLTGKRYFPLWLKFEGYSSAIRRAPLSVPEAIRCYAQLGRLLVDKANLRLTRRLDQQVDRRHLAVPVEGVEWS